MFPLVVPSSFCHLQPSGERLLEGRQAACGEQVVSISTNIVGYGSDGLGICSSMKVGACDGVWPVNPQNPPEAAVLEDLQLLAYAHGHLPRF